MHVLHVCQPTEAGVPQVVKNLAAHQVSHNTRVTIACPSDGPLVPAVLELGADVIPWSATREPGPRVPGEVRALSRIIARVRPDIVHLHSAKAGLAGRLAIRGRLGTIYQPHAWSFHAASGLQRVAARRWEAFSTRWTDLTIAVSDGERRDGVDAGIGGEYRVIPNGVPIVDLGSTARDTARRALGISDSPAVVCVGRLCEQKGQMRLLQEWDEIQRQVPGCALYLVGDGPDSQHLRDASGHLANVHLTGATDDARLWLTASDVVALPSRWEAGLSLVAMEAMSVGRSVVLADVSGARDGVLPDCGAVVDQDDGAALAAAITKRLRDPEIAHAEGVRGRARVEARFGLEAANTAVMQAYDDVILRRLGAPLSSGL